MTTTHAPAAGAETGAAPVSGTTMADSATTEIYTLSLHDALPIS